MVIYVHEIRDIFLFLSDVLYFVAWSEKVLLGYHCIATNRT